MEKYKIKITEKIPFILFLLAEVKLFYVFKLPEQLAKPGSPAFCAIIGVFFFTLYVFKKHSISVDKYGNFILVFVIYLFWEILVATIQFPDQGFISAISWVFQYCVLLYYFPLSEAIKRNNNYYCWLKQIVCIFAFILSVLLIAECASYNLFRFHILNIYGITYGYNAKIISRIGSTTLRLYGVIGAIVPLSILISFDNLLKGKYSKIFSMLCIISGLFCIYYVSQGRVTLLCSVICLIVMFLYSFKEKITKKQLAMFGLVIIAIIIPVWHFSNYFESLILDIMYSNDSFAIRLDEIKHYISYWEKYPLFGTGLLVDSRYNNILKGPSDIFGVDDVGIFGVLFRFGLLGLIWYLMLGISLMKQSIKKKNALCITVSLHFWMCCFTLSYLDLGRVILLLLTIVVLKNE